MKRFTNMLGVGAALGLGVGVAGALASAAAPAASAGPTRALPFTPTVDKLPNGLTVVTVPTTARGIVAYYTVVRTGSRDEVEKGHSGFAHFFEHMMFRGTKKYSTEKYSEILQRHGADDNAFTTDDFTCYTIVAPKAALADIIDIESDRFMNLDYPEDDFKTESKAVLGEYNKNYSNPVEKMWETLSETAFAKHTYAHTTMGYLADIKAMPGYYKYSRDFFKRFYTPDNATVLVVGDVARDELLPAVEKAYGAWKGKRAEPKIPAEPPLAGPKSRHMDWDADTAPRILAGWRTPAFNTATTDTAALEMLHQLVLGESAPLYKRLVIDAARPVDFGSWEEYYHRDPELFIVLGELKDAKDIDRTVDDVQAAFDELAAGKVDAKRLEEIKSYTRYHTIMRLDTVASVAYFLADFVAMTGDVNAAEAFLQRIGEVTPADVTRVAKTYLGAANRAVVTLTPKGGK
jgi:zinc protease